MENEKVQAGFREITKDRKNKILFGAFVGLEAISWGVGFYNLYRIAHYGPDKTVGVLYGIMFVTAALAKVAAAGCGANMVLDYIKGSAKPYLTRKVPESELETTLRDHGDPEDTNIPTP